ncbi:hypothetical protein DSM03_10535 [Leeuwenhoekiella aestuarii]|uniref:DUF192 domain-containing protein n=1 Tax=Leeuwenhoekiella aestuarii TaxID=2249426 RepID=A0A4Q0NSM8_9FLAO|nr:DUF192 domain-containing protein [Leeuwenhoekiella aestuarii]RXG12554.1 hypothetical protein DSM04_10635 [Leeuwenhoekiella aestuarii]RXG14501.1 hypothetical protein DSM03_10535 [Leeuwenhoekiella aestuarii]
MFKKLVFLALGFSTIISCKNQESEPTEIPQEQIAFTQEGKLQIIKQNEEKVYFNIEIVDTDYETETGLMYREFMEQNQAMLFVFKNERPHSFYMKNTYIPLDLFFITKEMKIATIIENAKPLDESSLPSEVPVTYVLETNAGIAELWDIKEGDSISWKRR